MRRRIIKCLAYMTASSLAVNTYAVAPGLYLGLALGPATNSGGTVQAQVQAPPGIPSTTTTPASPKSNQFGSRLFLGYQLNNYAAFEGGLNYFTGIKYDTKGVPTCSSPQARVRSFDATVKGIMPFGSSFDAYGKAGAALIYYTTSGSLNPDFTNECGKSTYVTQVRPTVSVGASYAFTQSWVVDASWNRTMVGGVINNVDFFALGLSYHFVNRYCGQFLCDD